MPLQSSEFAYYDAMRLASVAALLTQARMRTSAECPGWRGGFSFETAPEDAGSLSPTAAGAACWGRALTFDPNPGRDPFQYETVSSSLDRSGAVYRKGWHHFLIYWQIPGPNGYNHLIIREILRACDEVMIPDKWGYLTGGDASDRDRPGFVSSTYQEAADRPMMTTHLRVLFAATMEG